MDNKQFDQQIKEILEQGEAQLPKAPEKIGRSIFQHLDRKVRRKKRRFVLVPAACAALLVGWFLQNDLQRPVRSLTGSVEQNKATEGVVETIGGQEPEKPAGGDKANGPQVVTTRINSPMLVAKVERIDLKAVEPTEEAMVIFPAIDSLKALPVGIPNQDSDLIADVPATESDKEDEVVDEVVKRPIVVYVSLAPRSIAPHKANAAPRFGLNLVADRPTDKVNPTEANRSLYTINFVSR